MIFTPVTTLCRLSNAINVVRYKSPRLLFSNNEVWTRNWRLLHDDKNGDINSDERLLGKREPPWNIMFFGTDEFALQSLVALHSEQKTGSGLIGKLDVVSVRLKKIIPAVSRYCQGEGLSLQTWPAVVPPGSYDLGIVVSFGHLLPSSIIKAFPLGILNVHGSLLPRWRGAAPIIHAVLNNDQETGITVMKIHPQRFDVGEIVSQASVPIPWDMRSGTLTKQLAALGAQELILALKRIPKILDAAVPQPNDGVTKAPKVKEASSRIVWEKHSCCTIQAMYRALDDYFPLWTTWHGTPVKLREMVMHEMWSYSGKNENREENNPSLSEECNSIPKPKGEHNKNFAGGHVIYNKKSKTLSIRCIDGYVSFRKVMVKGRKPMTAGDFYNGFISKKTKDFHQFQ